MSRMDGTVYWNSNFFRRLTNTLTVNYKYSRSNSENSRKQQSQKLRKSAEKYFYTTFSSFWANQVKPFLVRSEILGLLVNTLTAKYEYSQSNSENLPLPIQRQLSKKPKTFCTFFVRFYCIFGIYIKF